MSPRQSHKPPISSHIIIFILCIIPLILSTSSHEIHVLADIQAPGTQQDPYYFNIVDYGAVANNETFNNAPIFRKVVELCESRRDKVLNRHAIVGGEHASGVEMQQDTPFCTIFVPEGTFTTSPFNLTSHMSLTLHQDAVIFGSPDTSLYPLIPALPSFGRGREYDNQLRYSALVSGFNVRNVRIEGRGTIDGNGIVWWKLRIEKKLQYTRGRLVEFLWSEDITITHVTLRNAPFWTLHPVYSKNILIEYIHIYNPPISPNTDGIDPNSCENVVIRHNVISAGDDNISIKSGWDDAGMRFNMPSRNISIYKNTLFMGDGIAIGSEMSGGVEDIHIHDNVYSATVNAVRLKTGYGRGGYVRNVTWENESLDGVATGIFFNMHYGQGHETKNETLIPKLRDITLRNLHGVSASAGDFMCLSGVGQCELRLMKDVHFSSVNPWKCENVVVHEIEGVHPKFCVEPEQQD